MEPITRLIDRMLSFALLDPRIEAVVLTGSVGRNKKIDSYSDIDIELIGHGATELAKNQHWLSQFGKHLVSLATECEVSERHSLANLFARISSRPKNGYFDGRA